MAKIVDTDYTGKFNLPIPIGRLNPTPADSTEIWKTLSDAETYAASGPTAYVGQIIYVQEEGKHYYISDTAGTLSEIASGTLSCILRGYYLNGEFYETSTYSKALVHDPEKFYIDLNGGTYNVYTYTGDGIGFKKAINIPDATDQIKGIVKLYNTWGENEDGAMTQKSVKTAIDGIKLAIDTSESECLILSKPW